MTAAYKNVFLEISGTCNARCPYCLSGRHRSPGGTFMTPAVFGQVVGRLKEQRLIAAGSVLNLFNWGEPFLHPRLGELLAAANREKVAYVFSTNASVLPRIDREFARGLKTIIFSMPGFSQSSYDRIHGFRFPTVCSNMATIVAQTRKAGFRGEFRLHYHVYQFNLTEIAACDAFARRLGIDLQLHYAILNHWDHLWDYLDDRLPAAALKELSQDLFTFRLRDLPPDAADSYRCPQLDLLVLDESANVLVCCQVPKGEPYRVGNLLEEPFAVIGERRARSAVCTRCIERGVARYVNTALPFPQLRAPRGQQLAKRLYRKVLRGVGSIGRGGGSGR